MQVEILRSNEADAPVITRLEQGSHFGEYGVLAYLNDQIGVRAAAARACSGSVCELYRLTGEDFATLASYYPEVADFFVNVAVVGASAAAWHGPGGGGGGAPEPQAPEPQAP